MAQQEDYEAKHKELSSNYWALARLNNELCKPDHEVRALLVKERGEVYKLREQITKLERALEASPVGVGHEKWGDITVTRDRIILWEPSNLEGYLCKKFILNRDGTFESHGDILEEDTVAMIQIHRLLGRKVPDKLAEWEERAAKQLRRNCEDGFGWHLFEQEPQP